MVTEFNMVVPTRDPVNQGDDYGGHDQVSSFTGLDLAESQAPDSVYKMLSTVKHIDCRDIKM